MVSGSCRIDQKSLLVRFHNSLRFNQSKSIKLVSWDLSSDCCDWAGVTCDGGGLGRVIGLNLSNESISSGIENPSALFRLGYLQNLDLSYNNFNTSIPASFATLTGLISLNLSNAGFVGQIPIEISYLTKLDTLDLSISQLFSGKRALRLENPNLAKLVQNLTHLTELHLDGVNISASGKEWCRTLSSSLPSLRVLSLSNCFLSGPFDSSLTKLHSLSEIRLDGNNFSSSPVPKFFASFLNLRILRLSSCGLQGKFPTQVFQVSRLEIIDLSFNKELQGYLPDGFQNASLKTLELSNTNFSGRLPDSIGALGNLTRINLATCTFTGPIPTSMENLTELVYLDFSSNTFTGSIPSLDGSKKLMYVDFSYNYLSGVISNIDWKGLSNLVHIDLKNNSFNGSIPLSLFAIQSLQKIMLSYNQFGGQIPEFPNASTLSLDTLDLSNNNLEGPVPHSVFELRRLNVLSLASNKFSGTIKLDQIQKLVNLTTVDLSYNKLTVDVNATNSTSSFPLRLTTLKLASCNLRMFPDLRNQSRITNLDLADNKIAGSVPPWIGQVGNGSLLNLNLSRNLLVSLPEPLSLSNTLAVLDLHSNQLQGNIPSPPPLVSVVDLSNNNFSSSIPYNIGDNLSVAIFFSLSNNRVEGVIPESLCTASYLEVLDLSNNSLIGSIPSCLIERSETLGVLNLRKNNFTGRIPDNFSRKCKLETLDLSGNLLEGKVPESLINCTILEQCHMGRLQIVDIALNSFTGRLPNRMLSKWKAMIGAGNETHGPIKFKFLKVGGLYYQDSITVTSKGLEMQLVKILTLFTSIDVSCNKFQGQIPERLGQFSALYILNLSHNALDGQIPPSLGNVSNLESLDLSNNHLTGEIPRQLTDLTFLSFLNLSGNELVGDIPTGRQFQTFENTSYRGNKGLCGPPLSKLCSHTPPGGKSERHIHNSNEFDWDFIVRGLGFGMGAGAIVAPIMFWKKANKWCDDRIDKILMVLLPMLGLVYYTKDDWRIAPEEIFEEDATDADEDYSEEEGDFEGRYCVFCTKLDITRTRAIHDLQCTCYHSPPISSSSSSSFSSSDSS
ncbi:serine-threonine protein kinase, plant-type, putative [Ricinus communis]|uniref:Serine-threonine protein kinase, plant-type, putative n=1 Tax=Ricinus communis TaxID=3988 RepID=B9SWX6_RICCO|nr:serine-threonine protein kinase, plant-type, putative [Ricinus communis]